MPSHISRHHFLCSFYFYHLPHNFLSFHFIVHFVRYIDRSTCLYDNKTVIEFVQTRTLYFLDMTATRFQFTIRARTKRNISRKSQREKTRRYLLKFVIKRSEDKCRALFVYALQYKCRKYVIFSI